MDSENYDQRPQRMVDVGSTGEGEVAKELKALDSIIPRQQPPVDPTSDTYNQNRKMQQRILQPLADLLTRVAAVRGQNVIALCETELVILRQMLVDELQRKPEREGSLIDSGNQGRDE